MNQELNSYKQMASFMQIGWYKVNMKNGICVCSDYIRNLIGLKSNKLLINELYGYIREDYREHIKKEMESTFNNKIEYYYNEYPIITKDHGEVWLNTTQRLHKYDCDTNNDIFFGTVKVIDPPAKQKGPKRINNHNDILLKLFSISQTLFDFLKKGNNCKTIISILEDIRKTIKGDRVYMIEYTESRRFQSNIYEVLGKNITSQISQLKNIPTKITPWLTENIIAEHAIILDSINQIPKEGNYEYELMKKQNVKSIICLPMINSKGVWGYMCVDTVKSSHKWSNDECQWLLSVCNVISICIELSDTKMELIKEHTFINNLIKYMPVGYAHVSMVKNKHGNPVDYVMIYYNDILKNIILHNMPITQPGHFGTEYPDKNLFKRRMDVFKHVIKNNTTEEHDTYFPLSGKHVHEISYCPSEDHVIDLYIDTTDILKNKNQIKDFENFFSLISQFAKIGYAKFNIISCEGYANKQWMANFNEKKDKPLAKIIGVYSTLYEEDRKRVIDFYEKAKNGISKHFTDDVRVINKNNSTECKWIKISIIVTKYDPDNKNIELIGINYDISQSKQVEKELTIARNKAMTMDQLKSAFLANMSHEIRTPLNAIVGFSNLLAESNDPIERNEYINILNENNELLLQLISDILDLSKIESGTFKFVFNNVELNQLCDDIVHSSQLKVNDNIKIQFNSKLNRCEIISDRNRLHQILSNFINNAIKFTEKGSITIGYDIHCDTVRFYCKDTGIGINKEQQSSIFERFIKLDNFVKGTGLGLAICQSIIQQMNGEIGVDSEPGKGSTFWFTIPYIKPTNTINAHKLQSNERNIKNKAQKPFILVAEDTESNYMLIMAVLSKQYKILWAHDGVEAIEMCRAMNPDLILMDPHMSRKNGLDATKAIRKFNKNIPIIAITAFTFEHDKNKAIDAGYDMVLSKPINSQDLRAAINKALEKNK
jgi:signal transduction histidine kinase/ActR/RegA family two-component response regulator